MTPVSRARLGTWPQCQRRRQTSVAGVSSNHRMGAFSHYSLIWGPCGWGVLPPRGAPGRGVEAFLLPRLRVTALGPFMATSWLIAAGGKGHFILEMSRQLDGFLSPSESSPKVQLLMLFCWKGCESLHFPSIRARLHIQKFPKEL